MSADSAMPDSGQSPPAGQPFIDHELKPGMKLSSAWWPLLFVISPTCLANLLIAPFMDEIGPHDISAPLVYACFGLIAAQVALVHIGLVYTVEPFWQRLLIAWGCGFALFLLWLIGFTGALWGDAYPSDRLRENLLRVICSLPLISLAIQTPLWLARVTFWWRFQCSRVSSQQMGSGSGLAAETSQITIRDLLIATAFIAISLGIARFAPQPTRDGAMRLDFWLGIGLFGGAAAAASTICIVPLLWIFARDHSLAACWGLAMLYAFVAEFIGLLIAFIAGFSGRLDAFDVFGFTVTVVCLAGGIAGGLTMTRWMGHRLLGSPR